MQAIKLSQATEIVGGWDPFGAAIQGATKGFNTGTQILGPLGGTVCGLMGLVGGFIAGFLSA
ncbi:hypothetical protein V8O11_02120 [Erwinia aphidicola]|uniref:hypothetical protein n=1 Tax=Erwinia aphidicola TaxID=68334 RepID=UPI00209ED03B|nr:hypothetical protein [Erwinia aphidicola]MCP2229725.1 hypothetical protein [Erwinia aphidicola]